jgi:hypothetical protein
MSIYRHKDHCTLYRDNRLGAQLQVMIRRNWSLLPRRERSYYVIDGMDRVFISESDLVHGLALREMRKRILRLPTARRDRTLDIDRSATGSLRSRTMDRADGTRGVHMAAGGIRFNR